MGSDIAGFAYLLGVQAVFWVPWIVIIVASVGYARRRRTRASTALAVGSVGYLASAVMAEVAQDVSVTLRADGSGAASALSDRVLGIGSVGLWGLSFAFLMFFAISLLLVLRTGSRGGVSAEASQDPSDISSQGELPRSA